MTTSCSPTPARLPGPSDCEAGTVRLLHQAITTVHQDLRHLEAQLWQHLASALDTEPPTTPAAIGHHAAARAVLKERAARDAFFALLVDALEYLPDLSCVTAEEDEEEGVLLWQCRDAFTAQGDPEVLSTAELLRALNGHPQAAGEEITSRTLAQYLAPFGIRPQNITVGSRRLKGYRKTAFDNILQR